MRFWDFFIVSLFMEIFKDVLKYKDLYEVSNTGIVRNKLSGKILNTSPNKKGYLQACLWINKKNVTQRVHRLVLETFKGLPIGDCNHGNHINGNRQDNRIENLEWVSNRENASHSIARQLTRTSNYPGVCWASKNNKYLAQVYFNKKNKYLGLFDVELDAYEAVKQFHTENNIINRYI